LSDCACRSATPDPASAVLVSLLGSAAVMPVMQTYAVSLSACALGFDSLPPHPSIPTVPDGPPPRS
jgi:hypothetical protein